MNKLRTIGLVLIVGGVLTFAYQGVVTFTTREKVIDAGPIEVVTEEKHRIPLAPILGIAALACGAILLFAGRRTS